MENEARENELGSLHSDEDRASITVSVLQKEEEEEEPGEEQEEEEEQEGEKHVNEDTVDLTENEVDIREFRKSEMLFYVQTAVIAAIVIACIINLSLSNGDQTAWTGLLSTSLGILLPQPGFSLKKEKK